MVVLILIFTKKHLKMIGVISDDSLSPVAQKRVVSHGFIHRLLTTPLSTKRRKEEKYFKEFSNFNGHNYRGIFKGWRAAQWVGVRSKGANA